MKPSVEPTRRGEVWLAALGAARAGEVGKTRPVLVMSLDQVDAETPHEPLVVVPFASSRSP
ncbi:MAG: type II toxin-antitoxin system PemK/MazF family toxin, partial [Bifidobacteriaceae bacterium]|nr:type II toxin-antitoxin system PemK/MazF family toxin [Bifidobacteriaceae bacterium]